MWWWGAQMAETLVSQSLATAGFLLVQLLFGVAGTKSWCGWGKAQSTLLGPERTTSVVFRRLVRGGSLGSLPGMAWLLIPSAVTSGWWGAVRVVGWSFVENCTVDASIFVVKLSRANGGCLGTRSR